MLTSLSSFFRSTLSKGRENITVGEEIRHVQSYLEIQQFRYHYILEYEISVPEEMHHYYIMKLSLQPLVENALYHGIKNKRGKGKISISGWMDGLDLLLFVRDNGIGMTEEELTNLREAVDGEGQQVKPVDSGHGFGLRNVQQRLKLRYGEEYGIQIESTYQVGTVITVRIPRLVEGDV
jgi:two-component system sensor histidine kinase YesM